MRFLPKPARLGVVALLGCSAIVLAAFVSTANGATTLTFHETNKSFEFIDNAPRTSPEVISTGDEFVLRNALRSGGKQIGTLQAHCVATNTARNPTKVEFLCTGTFKFGGKGTLTATAINKGAHTSGGITGGTGSYVGAHGSFKSTDSKSGATTTITLLE